MGVAAPRDVFVIGAAMNPALEGVAAFTADDLAGESISVLIFIGTFCHAFFGCPLTYKSFSVWLCQIAKNTYFSYLKKQPYLLEDIDNAVDVPNDDFEQKIIADGSAYEIHKLIHDLEEPYKEVFMLRFFGDLSFCKIAELFGKTESWARVTYHRARAKLKEALL